MVEVLEGRRGQVREAEDLHNLLAIGGRSREWPTKEREALYRGQERSSPTQRTAWQSGLPRVLLASTLVVSAVKGEEEAEATEVER